MKKKFIFFVLIFALSLCIIPRQKAFAATSYSDAISNLSSMYNNVYLLRYHVTNSWYNGYSNSFTSAGYHVLLIGDNSKREIVIANGYPIIYYNSNRYPYHSYSSTQYSDQFTEEAGYFNCYPSSTYYPNTDRVDYQTLVLIKGDFYNHPDNNHVYYDYDEFIDSITPKWYETLYQNFIDYLNEFGLDNPGLIGLIDWFSDFWTVEVGEGEAEQTIDIVTPTPTPTPLPTPTPIPYQTQLVPDGNGGYNIQYVYINPSGVPTVAPQPPTNEPQPTSSVTINDDDWEYPYYDNPNNKDDPYQLDIPWYLKFTFKNTVTSLDDFQDGMDAIVDNVNDQDDNINVVMDSMGLFPNDWLLMIGFIGAIPLVGGLISRLLKG